MTKVMAERRRPRRSDAGTPKELNGADDAMPESLRAGVIGDTCQFSSQL